MDRITRLRTPGRRTLIVLAAGVPFSLWGCGTSTSDEYQTFSQADAERVDAARAEAHEALANAAASPGEDNAQSAPSSAMLIAARRAALVAEGTRAALPPEKGAQPEADTVDPAPVTPPSTSGSADIINVAALGSPAEQMAQFLTDKAAQTVAALVRGEPLKRQIQLLIPEQSFSVEGPEDAIRVSYNDLDLLKVINMEPVPVDAVDYFPKWLQDLNGKRIRIRGFMYPTFEETGLRGFLLARDNQICCFGRNPKIYDLFPVAMRDGETTNYIQGRPFDVVGVFHISPDVDGDKLWQLYEIDDAIVLDN